MLLAFSTQIFCFVLSPLFLLLNKGMNFVFVTCLMAQEASLSPVQQENMGLTYVIAPSQYASSIRALGGREFQSHEAGDAAGNWAKEPGLRAVTPGAIRYSMATFASPGM